MAGVDLFIEDEGYEGITREEIGRVRSRQVPAPAPKVDTPDDSVFCTGSGTMRERAPGRWEMRFSLGQGTTRYRKSMMFGGTREEAEDELQRFTAAHHVAARTPVPGGGKAWRESAECRGVDPTYFFPDETAGTAAYAYARVVCARCPVIDECLEYAMSTDATSGLFGGTGFYGGKTPAERRELLDRAGRLPKQGPLRTHCALGHEMDYEYRQHNGFIYMGCSICRKAANDRRRARLKAEKASS